MHIAFTYKVWNVAPFIVALLCGMFFSGNIAHAQVSEEAAAHFAAQLTDAQEQIAQLAAHQGKVLGVSTLSLTSSSYAESYSSILKQIESLKSKIESYKSGSSLTTYSSDSSSRESWNNSASVTARKAAIQKQMNAIDDRIEALQKQKAELQTQLDKLNGSSTDATNLKNSKGIRVIHESDAATKDGSKGVYKITFAIKAKDADVYIKDSAVSSTLFSKTAGANFIIQKKGTSTYQYRTARTVVDWGHGAVTTGATDATLTSDASKSGGYYKIAKGESETFTLAVMYTPSSSGSYQMRLMGINWNTSASEAMKRTSTFSNNFATDLLAL